MSLPATSYPPPVTRADEVLVRVEGVSKKFCRSLKKSLWYGVCDIASELLPFGRSPRAASSGLLVAGNGNEQGSAKLVTSDSPRVTPHGLRPDEFYAVRDVSFELRRGECLGLIGHNGAGKTTLLKMLNGLIKPDAGKITMRGRVGALIALGAGFNPILTGRENIYINASVLGISKKEIDEKIEEIIDFAEIGEFIDSPVQNYSSGMSVRLGFAIASSLNPDVLILDEVLAVGDIGFVIKCLNRVRKMTANAAVVLVSHQMQFISSFCSRVVFMGHGKALLDTQHVGEAIDRYYEMIAAERNETGTMEATVEEVSLEQGVRLRQGEEATLRLKFRIKETSKGANLHIYIMDESVSPIVCQPIVDEHGLPRKFGPGTHEIVVSLGSIDLVAGKYSFTLSLADEETKRSLLRSQGLHEFRVFADRADWGRVVRPAMVR